jgi:putative oxidoreductase
MAHRCCSGGLAGRDSQKLDSFSRRWGSSRDVVTLLVAALAELGGGVLLASGLATSLSAAIIFAVMIVAAFSAHIKQGFFITDGGFEYTFVLSVAALTVAFTGPGSFSLDAILGHSWSGGLWGLAAILTGVLASIVPLAQRRQASANLK